METHFDEELKAVKKEILEMAALVEESITKSLEALKKRDIKLAKTIREIDQRIDRYEIAIEERCIELIARHQPVGSDLRFLIGVIKMNNDLERMGDHAVNIADCVGFLSEQPRIKPVSNIWTMAKITNEMLKESVESFMTNDPLRAQKVCERDSTVDQMRNETVRILLTYMLEEPDKIGSAIQYLLVAKNLERIADLSTNICEDTIYIAQARVIKHHAEEKKLV
uniref:Phosphate-specific transport system accessory protein PhoU n=1 Tax=candidate division WOR-3 bacterium TaxID=2052148 RepID=A0A7C4TDC2_UNCW3